MSENNPMKARISGIVLAAGHASRIGMTKQLLEFRQTTLLGQVVTNARRSLLDEIIVVLGHDAAVIQRRIDFEGVRVVVNRDYLQGQSTSLKTGLSHVSSRSNAAMFLLGDQPLVDESFIDTLIRAFEESSQPLVMPVFGGRRGNPVIIGRDLFGELAAGVQGDVGARVLFKRHVDSTHEVEVDSRCIHVDVDTLEDYRNLLAMDQGHGKPLR
ncbi:MAG: nucleotidyltransferase family protein [Deltaproteobacteria bacterium]|nr:nucleotidyltransferase family protein [Deltaproteobacteria bacterium]